MIEIIYGSKGTGKTKKIIDMANQTLDKSDGFIVFLTDTNRYVREIKFAIRFLNSKEAQIKGEECLIGFIKGLISANYDIKDVFIDGAARIAGVEISEMGSFMKKLDDISEKYDVHFVLTVSCDKEDLPDFFAKYID
ncbi:MAG: hypothetical protein ACOCWI_01770 [Bacillota bacterium]